MMVELLNSIVFIFLILIVLNIMWYVFNFLGLFGVKICVVWLIVFLFVMIFVYGCIFFFIVVNVFKKWLFFVVVVNFM